jgi:predicted metal-dependent phosphoesterase TrpH
MAQYETAAPRPPVHLPAGAVVDLHMHSPLSDGQWTPATLPPAAHALALRVIALTDHDEILGVPAMAQAAAAYGIACIPAVEVSTRFQGIGFHLLLYGIDLQHPALQAKFTQVRTMYDVMIASAMHELARLGKPLDPQRDPRLAAPTGRKVYHLVDALTVQGFAPNYREAYELCKQAGASYIWQPPMAEMLALAHEAGGVGVIAHPGRAEAGFTATTRDHLDAMVAIGLDGVEAYHSFHRPADVTFLLQYAAEKGLLVGCGSDSHGPGPGPSPLTAWPATHCQALLERCGFVLDPAGSGKRET